MKESDSRQINFRMIFFVGAASFLLFSGIFLYASWHLEERYNSIRKHAAYTTATVDKMYITHGRAIRYNVEYHFSLADLSTFHGIDSSGFSDNYMIAFRDHKVRVGYDLYNPSNSEIDVTGWLNKPTPKSLWFRLIAFILSISLFLSTILALVVGIVFGQRGSD